MVQQERFAAPLAPWAGGPNQGFGNAGKDAIILPGLFNFNLSAFKNFSFTENVKLQMRFESFNTFNHTEFQNIDSGYQRRELRPGDRLPTILARCSLVRKLAVLTRISVYQGRHGFTAVAPFYFWVFDGTLLRSTLCALQRGLGNTLAFLDRHQLIAFDARKALDQPIRPMDLKIGMSASVLVRNEVGDHSRNKSSTAP